MGAAKALTVRAEGRRQGRARARNATKDHPHKYVFLDPDYGWKTLSRNDIPRREQRIGAVVGSVVACVCDGLFASAASEFPESVADMVQVPVFDNILDSRIKWLYALCESIRSRHSCNKLQDVKPGPLIVTIRILHPHSHLTRNLFSFSCAYRNSPVWE
jgi:hypothetical protein